jgi:Immunity protein 21
MLELIDSNGGPLLMLERDLLLYWGGISNIGGIANPHRNIIPFDDAPCDYNRACEIRGWIGPLQVGNRAGVVFWGDDLGFGLVRESDTVFFAVRPFVDIDNLEDHIEIVKENPESFKKELEIVISPGKFIVFDSACPGWDLTGGRLEMDVLPGRYEVFTYWQKVPNAEVVFHKFCRSQSM